MSEICKNCVRLKKEVEDLRSLLYPPNDAIPEAAWSVFPENGKYLKKILVDYGGYSTRKSLLKLENPIEVENLFEFVRDMAEDIDDENERKELLGVFHKNPKKLKILPGLVDVFQAFIQNNKSEQMHGKKSRSHQTVSSNSERPVSTSDGEIDPSVTSSSLIEQLEKWVSCKIEENYLQEKLQNCSKENFSSTFSLNISKKECVCLVCERTLLMPKKISSGKTKLSISNVTRHMKNCWLKTNKMTGKQMSTKMLVNKTSVPQPRSIFFDLMNPMVNESNEMPPAINDDLLLNETNQEIDFETNEGHKSNSKRIKLEITNDT